MRHWRAWIWIIAAVSVVVVAAVLYRTGAPRPGDGAKPLADAKTHETGPFRVDVAFRPDPPRTGTNAVVVEVRDAEGEPVEDATVSGAAVMPQMGAMPEMRATGQVSELGGGRFQLVFDLSMGGPWPLTLNIQSDEKGKAKLQFDYTTGTPVRSAGGAGPGGPGEEPGEGTVRIDARRRQLIGVKTAPVERKPLVEEIRTIGWVDYDETRLSDVSLKYRAWIGKVYADYTGIEVKKGEPLFTIYSPELYSAQEELLETIRRAGGNRRSLADVARRRLELWDLSERQIAEIAERGEPSRYLPILSPSSGTVIEKNVVEGSGVADGARLYRIADLSTVWVEADVYEADLPLVEVGQEAKVTLSYLPGETFNGKIAYVYPYLDDSTRTGRIRFVVPNPDGRLKPKMYAEARLEVALGEKLVVPESAVLRAGDTNVVFLDRGEGYLEPRRIRIGRKSPQGYVVLEGLEEGDVVVTSGNFLIASESKLKAGIEKW